MTTTGLMLARTGVGLAQGHALYLLYRVSEAKAWPATDGLIFAPLLVTAIFVPLLVVTGLGNMRARTLLAWGLAATLICAGLGFYDIFRAPLEAGGTVPRIAPGTLWPSLGGGLFILHALIAAGDTDRRFIAAYPTYFDVAWRQGLQIVLASLIVAVFWGLLWLSAELFRLIKIEFLMELIKKAWFWIPVTTLVATYGLHITDVRAAMTRGTRTLVLQLFSWLLPIMAVMALAFLCALPFTGLEPLWNTRQATVILLITAATLVFLINDVYQDGRDEATAPVLRYTIIPTAFALVPLVLLAAYGVGLRIEQYGWTPRRILTVACIVVTACYAIGYALAVIRPVRWFGWIATTNVAAAVVILFTLLALLTPLADPARLSVADQVARLESGEIAPDKFDFAFLRFDSGRYGQQALERLKRKTDGENATTISFKANEALDWRFRYQQQEQQQARTQKRISPQERQHNISVAHPKGETLPDTFLRQEWSTTSDKFGTLPRCLSVDVRCEAILIDLDDDGQVEILIVSIPAGPAVAFKQVDGKWGPLGRIVNAQCGGVSDGLRQGKVTVAPGLKDVLVNGIRLSVAPSGC